MDFENLNKRQVEAATSTEGRIRVIAGAGSGKTKALSHRYAYIVNELGIDPANILCLTFTNKAAQEMKIRIAKLVPPGYSNDFVCTIHGFCVKFLREEIFRLGYTKTFQILDEDDVVSIAKQVLQEHGISRAENTVKSILTVFAILKNKTPYITNYLLPEAPHPIPEDDEEKMAVEMLMTEKKTLSLDFTDLVKFTLYILGTFPEVKAKWQERMSYVMVDEVQDCNTEDWEIINAISEGSGNLFIVGDPDQAIYEWRGSRPEMFVNFPSDKDIILDENYRSTSHILGVANSIIKNNVERIDKTLYTNNASGSKIIHFHGKDEKEESKWIAQRIVGLAKSGVPLSDIAILYRAAHLSRSVEQAMMKAGLPYTIWGGIRFFERKEIKDALSYLRLVATEDDLSFERIVNVPSRKIGKEKLKHIKEYAKDHGCTLFSALREMVGPRLFEGMGEDPASQFVGLIENCQARVDEMKVSDLLDFILKESGLMNMYREDNDEERLENLEELLQSIKLYEEDNKEEEDMSLDTYLQDIALYTNADYKKDANKVKLMTIHQSKGLEFPYVFITGLSEGIFPSYRCIRERKKRGLEEERRLMYVATTRAEKELYLTESEGYSAQIGQGKYPSRFITEIKRSLFVTEGEMEQSLWKGTIALAHRYNGEDEELESLGDIRDFSNGGTVVHPHFGKGTVISQSNDGRFIKVQFACGVRNVRTDTLQEI